MAAIPVDDIELEYSKLSKEQREHITNLIQGRSHVCLGRLSESEDGPIISVSVREAQLPVVFDSLFSTLYHIFGVYGTFDGLRKAHKFVRGMESFNKGGFGGETSDS